MPNYREPEKGSYVKFNMPDWFNTQEAKEILSQASLTGLPTTHIRGKQPSQYSQLLIPFDDGESPFKKQFMEHTWLALCAKAVKMHVNHGLIWLTNYKEIK